MYSLTTPLDTVRGIGPKLSQKLAEQGYETLQDLLLFLPLRYSDRSEIVKVADLEENKLVSFSAKITSISGFYKNRRRMDAATAQDETGKVKLMWFNNKFISKSVKKGETYMISGKLNNRGTVVQPTVELAKAETVHTGRLVPIYSSTIDIPQGSLRRVLKHSTDQLESSSRADFNEFPEKVAEFLTGKIGDISLREAIIQLHFPDSEEKIVEARERLALEELLSLIKVSERIKDHWKNLKSAEAISLSEPKIPKSIPFELTGAQKRSIDEILSDLQSYNPMNRVLIGDVGSGKTVVAGIAAQQVLNCGHSVAFVAPTKILAEQHLETLQELFPSLELELLTGRTNLKKGKGKDKENETPKLYIGTHAVINKLRDIDPGLIIYDEQHRFGVKQRSAGSPGKLAGSPGKSSGEHGKLAGTPRKAKGTGAHGKTPHTLTMSATPIPRSLMLTIFSHLKVSFIDEMPAGRIPVKTWVVPEKKREASYDWIAQELEKEKDDVGSTSLALVICPFIDPSSHEAFENVASTKEVYEKISQYFGRKSSGSKSPSSRSSESKSPSSSLPGKTTKLRTGLLHGRMKKDEQDKIIKKLYENKIDILVTTPIVEVGVDLPAASIIVIESADRFGMASLHQLRGRVGRAGQQGYCLLFSDSHSQTAKTRLKQFSQENNGLKLAELDLKNRGSGDIFGTMQSGFSQLKYATWTNLELISAAKQVYQMLPTTWQPLFNISKIENETKPLAN